MIAAARRTRRDRALIGLAVAVCVCLPAAAVVYQVLWPIPVGLCGLGLAAIAFHVQQGAVARAVASARESDGNWADTLSRGLKEFRTYVNDIGGRSVFARLAYRPKRSDGEDEGRKRRRLVRHLTRAQRIARVGSWEWQRATGRISCSLEVPRILGVPPEDFRLRPADAVSLIHRDDRRSFRRWFIQLAKGRPQPGLDIRVMTPAGDLRYVQLLGEALVGANKRIVGIFGTVQEATERTRAIEEIHRLAYFDALTSLPNRANFDANLEQTLARSQRTGKPFAIMFLDLDQFKRINDTLGHAVGDELLRIVAQRLTRVLRLDAEGGAKGTRQQERDVCRRGGDEFIILLNGLASEQDAGRIARRILDAVAQPVILTGHRVFVSGSIGIVRSPADGIDLNTLLMNADVAMYEAKAQGRNRYSFYKEAMRQETAQRMTIENELRQAVESQQFVLYYQPQVDVRSGRIVGVEALLRWNHPTRGLLSPDTFIAIAEETGLIGPIWEWVLVSVLIQHNTWREMGIDPVPIGVNLSTSQLIDPQLIERLAEIAQIVGVAPSVVELEVTESMLMVDFDAAVVTLNQLRAMGVKIAIDDFGTGYSSLSYLRRLPFDKLKLDRSFTRDATASDQDAAITQAIVSLANTLGLTVVAEGVETVTQLKFLMSLGCSIMQGYLLGYPQPGNVTSEILKAARRSDFFTPPPQDVTIPPPPRPAALIADGGRRLN